MLWWLESGRGLFGSHYTVDYAVADVGVTLADVKFDVSGAKDLAGNTQVAATAVTTGTNVDTENATVSTVALSDLHITDADRSEQHTSALPSPDPIVCRLLPAITNNAGTT